MGLTHFVSHQRPRLRLTDVEHEVVTAVLA